MREHAATKEPNMQKSYRVSLNHLSPFFAGLTLDKIDTDMVLRYIDSRRAQGGKPGTRNRELSMLSKAFNLARLWKWSKENPCQLITREKEDNADFGRCLTYEQEAKLLPACKNQLQGDLYVMVVVWLHTGMRREEVLAMSWNRIDMEARVIHSFNEKTNQPKDVPMNGAVYAVLSRRLKVRSITGYVFTTSNGTPYQGRNVYRAFKVAVKEAGITGRFRIHDLRHTTATRLIEAGADIYAVASVLDHSQLSTTKRYAKHSVQTKRRVLNALGRLPQESRVSKSYDFLTVGANAGKEEYSGSV